MIMKVKIKNSSFEPSTIKSLFDYFQSLNDTTNWEFNGLVVEIDPTFDFLGNDALIRWTDVNEGFNDKIIVKSLKEFQSYFHLINA